VHIRNEGRHSVNWDESSYILSTEQQVRPIFLPRHITSVAKTGKNRTTSSDEGLR